MRSSLPWGILFAAAALFATSLTPETRRFDVRPSEERAEEDRERLGRSGPIQNYGKQPVRSDAGIMRIKPASDVRTGEAGTWTLTFEVGLSGLAVDDGLLVYIPHGWSGPMTLEQGFPSQLGYNNPVEKATSTSAGLCTATASNPATKIRLFTSWKDSTRLGEGLNLWVAVAGAPLEEGDWIQIVYGDRRHGGPGALTAYFSSQFEFNTMVFRQMDWVKFNEGAWISEQGKRPFGPARLLGAAKEFFYVDRPPRIRTIGREARTLDVFVPSRVRVRHAFDIQVVVRDPRGNPASGYAGTIQFQPQNDVVQPAEYSFSDANEPFVRFTGAGQIHRTGVYRLKVRDPASGLAGVSNPIEIIPDEQDRVYWGDLHIHTWESDGLNTVSDAYRYGREMGALDFCAISDHSNGVKSPQRRAAQRFLDDGRFVTFSGYEQTVTGGGHVNIYFLQDRADYDSVYSPVMSKQEFWEKLRSFGSRQVIAVPHNHAGGGWEDFDDEVVRLNEIYSVWGNSEAHDPDLRPYVLPLKPKKRRNYQDALKRGLRLGCIGSGDEHAGRPGYGDWLRHFRSWHNGLVAAIAPSLGRKEIFSALWDRSVYATTGVRIILDFELNGHGMGSVISAEESAPRELRVKVIGTTDLRAVELIRNDEIAYSFPGRGPEASFQWRDETRPGGQAYYYVRVTQQDTNMAWSSPIWVIGP